jgi:hypothetical protein
MTDAEFMAWLHGFCAATRGCDFGPLIARYRNEDGSINREKTLEAGSFASLSASCRKKLLTMPGGTQ